MKNLDENSQIYPPVWTLEDVTVCHEEMGEDGIVVKRYTYEAYLSYLTRKEKGDGNNE